jgi:hypothetical protein
MSRLILYILMRTDLPSMNAGRAMAQASHAANQFIHENERLADGGENMLVKQWAMETRGGFGTAIVLSATLDDIERAVKNVGPTERAAKVVDPSYGRMVSTEVANFIPAYDDVEPRVENGKNTTFYRSEVTCAYVFGWSHNLEHLKVLSLHP